MRLTDALKLLKDEFRKLRSEKEVRIFSLRCIRECVNTSKNSWGMLMYQWTNLFYSIVLSSSLKMLLTMIKANTTAWGTGLLWLWVWIHQCFSSAYKKSKLACELPFNIKVHWKLILRSQSPTQVLKIIQQLSYIRLRRNWKLWKNLSLRIILNNVVWEKIFNWKRVWRTSLKK